MAKRWKGVEHCNGIIKSKDKKFINGGVAMDSNTTKEALVELLGDMDFSVIRELCLESKQLTYLSEELGVRLTNLVHLDLSNNELKTLPQSLQCLTQLNSLILNQNSLIALPLIVTKIVSLKVLDVSKNRIETLLDNLSDLECLETLNLSSNYLSSLPDSCETLNQLKTLNLSMNCLKTLPKCVTDGMKSLESLDLSGNISLSLGMAPASKKLKRLYLKNLNRSKKFPAWLLKGGAPDLQFLDCDGTNFKHVDFPENQESLKLKILSMQDCGVFDKFVKNLTQRTDQLETLRVGNKGSRQMTNSFWKLPIKSLQRPTLLTELSVRATGLKNVCREIEKFVNLVKLDLSDNKIYSLPNEICRLDKLNVLLVDENDLNSLPDNIGSMRSLKELKADSNHLAHLPKSVIELKQLLYIDLYENEFGEFPEELNNVKSLLGVDIDLNDFSTDDLCIGDSPYEALRRSLRERYQVPEYARITGRRYESEAEELSDTKSDRSSIACDEPVTTCEPIENCTTDEENWERSYDSAEDFDPTGELREPIIKDRSSYLTALMYKTNFCPADLHNIPVRQQIALMRQKGELEDEIGIQEGQFDDA